MNKFCPFFTDAFWAIFSYRTSRDPWTTTLHIHCNRPLAAFSSKLFTCTSFAALVMSVKVQTSVSLIFCLRVFNICKKISNLPCYFLSHTFLVGYLLLLAYHPTSQFCYISSLLGVLSFIIHQSYKLTTWNFNELYFYLQYTVCFLFKYINLTWWNNFKKQDVAYFLVQ